MAARLRDPAGKREALILAATKLFARQGYDGTRTAQIAARAGCAEGLIHRYFGGKKGLLLALIQQRASKEVVELTDQLPIARTLEEEVLHLVEWEVRNMWHDRDFLRVIISRALVEPRVGKVLSQAGLARHVPAFVRRLKHFEQRRRMSDGEIEGVGAGDQDHWTGVWLHAAGAASAGPKTCQENGDHHRKNYRAWGF